LDKKMMDEIGGNGPSFSQKKVLARNIFALHSMGTSLESWDTRSVEEQPPGGVGERYGRPRQFRNKSSEGGTIEPYGGLPHAFSSDVGGDITGSNGQQSFPADQRDQGL
jgi:hypothetical protein